MKRFRTNHSVPTADNNGSIHDRRQMLAEGATTDLLSPPSGHALSEGDRANFGYPQAFYIDAVLYISSQT